MAEPTCEHAIPQAADQLHGVCVFCYRDRLGKLRYMLAECAAVVAKERLVQQLASNRVERALSKDREAMAMARLLSIALGEINVQ